MCASHLTTTKKTVVAKNIFVDTSDEEEDDIKMPTVGESPPGVEEEAEAFDIETEVEDVETDEEEEVLETQVDDDDEEEEAPLTHLSDIDEEEEDEEEKAHKELVEKLNKSGRRWKTTSVTKN